MANTVEETIAEIRELHWKVRRVLSGLDPSTDGDEPYVGTSPKSELKLYNSQLKKLYIRLIAIPIT